MSRKKLLFITQALGHGIGGSEKALIEMLDAMDTNLYDITVLSLCEAPEIPYINNKIKIIYGEKDLVRLNTPLKPLLKSNNFTMGEKLSRIKVSLLSRKKECDLSKIQWQNLHKYINTLEESYDVAIGYGVGLATYFVIDKVDAKIKIGWLNTSLADSHMDIDYCRTFYDKFDSVVTDSESGRVRFLELYKDYAKPVYTVRNLLNVEELRRRGNEGEGFSDSFKGLRILSVGRLCEAKAFHKAVDAAKILKDKGLNFKWYIIGFGNLENDLRLQIQNNGLEDYFVLLGAKTNPYPFFKECDIYVQTSIFEGSCITIEEAMAFYRPVVSTNFKAAYEKIIDGENGFITGMEPSAIADAVEKLIESSELRVNFTNYQKDNPLNYNEELNKFNHIVDNLLKS